MAIVLPSTVPAWQYNDTTSGIENDLTFNPSCPLPPTAKALKAGELLIKISHAALNPVDIKVPAIPLVARFVIGFPAVPALDFSRTAAAISSASKSDIKVGDRVYGFLPRRCKFGSSAAYTVAKRSSIARVPEGVNLRDAASAGAAGVTALQSLAGHLKSGDRVFITGGSGGVGLFAIQIAKALRAACVVVTCSAGNEGLVRSVGADEVIDYRSKDVVKELKEMEMFDHVVDIVGVPANLYWESHNFLKEGGKYVQVGGPA